MFLISLFTKVILPLVVFSPLVLYILILPANYNKTFTIPRENVNPIKILRDEFAVPHIQASSLRDAFYAMGFLQAQDRLWEMSFKKLLFSGRLSEFFGEKTLGIDQTMRNFLFSRTSKINYQNMPAYEKDLFQAFADGVNDYADKLQILSLEFLITGVTFEHWSPADTLLIFKLSEFNLALKWNFQFLRNVLEEFYDREFIKELTGSGHEYQYDKTYILSDEELKQSSLYDEKQNNGADPQESNKKKEGPKKKNVENIKDEYLLEGLKNILDMLTESGRGSNSWVISGKYTKTGKPILANDPHLSNSLPSIWYPVYLNYIDKGKERKIFGFSFSGIPLMLIGQTEKISWGITTLIGDDSDLYKEELNTDRTHYKVDEKFYPLDIFQEEIKVKGYENPVLETIRLTKHGVILNKIFDFQIGRDPLGERGDFSLAWVGHHKDTPLLKTILGLYNANNVYEAQNVPNIYETVYLNLIFADVEGNIGYIATGIQNIKKKDVDDFFPLDGTDSSNDWLGIMPKNSTPFVLNPSKGYIVTANNQLASENIKSGKSKHCKAMARAPRINRIIRELIKNGTKIGIDEVKRIQQDQIDEYAIVISSFLIKIVRNKINVLTNQTERNFVEEIIKILEKWDGSMTGDSKEAGIYNVWFSIWVKKLFHKIARNTEEKNN